MMRQYTLADRLWLAELAEVFRLRVQIEQRDTILATTQVAVVHKEQAGIRLLRAGTGARRNNGGDGQDEDADQPEHRQHTPGNDSCKHEYLL